ncbi:DUF2087 domain-containing protein [Lactobacillus gigeriorum]|uniref:DUF2087 domain-containing protein n=1 Tax=Lactobacillus gigeriorum DSM 23908 = CRBIP 24.85 TaxID=1423751 RepID=I7LCS9_9LACO|nr:DUF2087 domain-containing protein [Lactobacillus gigeriorum]KRN13788.1 hypothetical protein FC38_GL001842 [Lactobacillus gigeriorum DSM 23908 = CRBIP 24.85]CCI86756.1 Putative uncharacterized protein [Lactobacillus gigeriorum DSM 23908 = CRBIP 24.85]
MALERFLKDGKLITIPRKQKAKEALFDALSEKFEFDRDYSEKEVNAILAEVYDDYAILRRYLVDTKRLARDDYGHHYCRIKLEK